MSEPARRPPIRVATARDAESLARLHVTAWQQTYTGLIPDGVMGALSVEARARRWRQILEHPEAFDDTTVFMADHCGDVAAFASFGRQRDATLRGQGLDGEISAIYVLREYQRAGLGSTLMREAAHALRQRGHSGAGLWVLCDNRPARRFYERLGGALVGTRQDVRPETTLSEVAYGWPDLARLASSRAVGTDHP